MAQVNHQMLESDGESEEYFTAPPASSSASSTMGGYDSLPEDQGRKECEIVTELEAEIEEFKQLVHDLSLSASQSTNDAETEDSSPRRRNHSDMDSSIQNSPRIGTLSDHSHEPIRSQNKRSIHTRKKRFSDKFAENKTLNADVSDDNSDDGDSNERNVTLVSIRTGLAFRDQNQNPVINLPERMRIQNERFLNQPENIPFLAGSVRDVPYFSSSPRAESIAERLVQWASSNNNSNTNHQELLLGDELQLPDDSEEKATECDSYLEELENEHEADVAPDTFQCFANATKFNNEPESEDTQNVNQFISNTVNLEKKVDKESLNEPLATVTDSIKSNSSIHASPREATSLGSFRSIQTSIPVLSSSVDCLDAGTTDDSLSVNVGNSDSGSSVDNPILDMPTQEESGSAVSIRTAAVLKSPSLEAELTIAKAKFANSKEPSIKSEIEEALQQEKVKIKPKAKVLPRSINTKISTAKSCEYLRKSLAYKYSPPIKRQPCPLLGGFIKQSPSEEGMNLSGLSEKEVARMFHVLGEDSKRRRVHWVSYHPPSTSLLPPKQRETKKLQINPRDYINTSFVDLDTGFTYTVMDRESDFPESPLANIDMRKAKSETGAQPTKRENKKICPRVEALGWEDEQGFQFIHLERRRPAFLFVSTDVPFDADGVHLILSRLIDDVHSFRTHSIRSGTRGRKKMHFALVNQSLRFSGVPKWQYTTQSFGLPEEQTNKGMIIQFKEEHRCITRRHRPNAPGARINDGKMYYPSSSSSSESIASSCSDSCQTDTPIKPCEKKQNLLTSSPKQVFNEAAAKNYREMLLAPAKSVREGKVSPVHNEIRANLGSQRDIPVNFARRRRAALKLTIPGTHFRVTSTPDLDYKFESSSDFEKLMNEELDKLDAEQKKLSALSEPYIIKPPIKKSARKRGKGNHLYDLGKGVVVGFLLTGALIYIGRKLIASIKCKPDV